MSYFATWSGLVGSGKIGGGHPKAPTQHHISDINWPRQPGQWIPMSGLPAVFRELVPSPEGDMDNTDSHVLASLPSIRSGRVTFRFDHFEERFLSPKTAMQTFLRAIRALTRKSLEQELSSSLSFSAWSYPLLL